MECFHEDGVITETDCRAVTAIPPQDGVVVRLRTRQADKILVVEKEAIFQVSKLLVPSSLYRQEQMSSVPIARWA
jgi:DNA topoisomerase VI subunit A